MFGCPTMIIGADVSHPGAGSLAPSMCAMTVSMDRLATRYAAACQSNGHRVEMIATWNINDIMGPLIKHWMKEVGGNSIPHHVMYFRDGISEGQYSKCLNEEIRDLKGIFKDVDTSAGNKKFLDCKFTVVVASKRHHIRFFPKPGVGADKNGNVHPGTLVEKDITHPFEYDFYLNSHSALQGTARPTHYHVLLDEKKMSATHLQNLIYESCYTYARSTTPVSICKFFNLFAMTLLTFDSSRNLLCSLGFQACRRP
jgi:eukaryotic translation initiation factor 2C